MEKIIGGGLTGEQLYNFISAVYIFVNKDIDIENERDKNKTLFLDGFVPLKGLKIQNIKKKTIDSLYNDTFKVYFNVKTGHIVACHRGTYGKNNLSWIKDVANNFRPFTYRRLIAKNGHNELLDVFIECAKEKNEEKDVDLDLDLDLDDYNNCLLNIRKIIKKHISDYIYNKEEEEEEDKIKDYFKNKLTTIGHSQGAKYAYLFGKDGKEIITYNPAPFLKTKPDNTYDVRIDKDLVSKLSGLSFFKKDKVTRIVLKQLPNIKLTTYHGREAIKETGGTSCFFGDNTLYSLPEDKKSLLNSANQCQIVLKDEKTGTIISKNEVDVTENDEDNPKSGGTVPRDNVLYLKTKHNIFKKNPKHSAYRSGFLVKEYKKRFSQKYGNKKNPYIGRKTKKVGLNRWFNEKWVNQRGEVGYKYKSDIYRPSVRITRKTPITYNELSRNDIKKARKTKYRKGRVNRFS
jgi:hypothetical protein